MKDKDPTDALRQELARHLEALVERLRQGEKAEDILLAPGIEVNLHIKEKKGRMAAKVSLKWLIPAYAFPDAVPCQDEGLRQLGDFKGMKKRLGATFKELQRTVAQGELPGADRLQEFVAAAREFSRVAEPAWQAEMQDFLGHAANLDLALKNGQLEMFRHELLDLQNQMIACHREHK